MPSDLILERDALLITQHIDAMPEAEKLKAADVLKRYRVQQETAGVELFPSLAKQQTDNRAKLWSAFDDPKTLDKENGVYAEADRLEPGLGDNLRASELQARFLADRYGQPLQKVRDDVEHFATQYSQKTWGEAVTDPAQFYAKAKADVAKERDEFDMNNEAFREATLAAMDGANLPLSLAKWQEQAAKKPGFSAGQSSLYMERYNTIARTLEKHRPAIDSYMEATQRTMQGKAGETDAATMAAFREKLLDMPANEQDLAMRAIATKALKLGEKGEVKSGIGGFFQETGESFGRFVSGDTVAVENALALVPETPGRITTSIKAIETPEQARAFMREQARQNMAQNYAAVSSSGTAGIPRIAPAGQERILTSEEATLVKAAKEREQRGIDLDRKIKRLAEQTDPVTGVVSGTLGPSLGIMAAMLATRGAALPVIAQTYAANNYNNIRIDHPDIAPQKARQIAVASGAAEAALDLWDIKILTKLPTVAGLIKNGLKQEALTSAARNVGGAYLAENIQEASQDLVLPLLKNAMASDAPSVDFEKDLRAFAQNRGDVAFAILPLVLIGGGVATARDYLDFANIEKTNQQLGEAGFIESDRVTILEAMKTGNAEVVDAAIVDASPRRMVEVAAEYQDKAGEKARVDMEFTQAAVAIANRENYTLRRDGEGWSLRTPDGATVKAATAEEAVSLLQQDFSEGELRNAQAVADMADVFLSQKRGGERIEVQPGQSRDIRDDVAENKITPEQAREAIVTAGKLAGLTEEEATQQIGAVLGSSIVEAEGVREAVSRIYQGGDAMTVVEETIEGRWKKGLKDGRYTPEQGAGWVRLAEQATGETYLPENHSERELVEAISYIIRADVMGRRKDGSRLAPGVVSRGLRESAMRGNKEAGKFSAFLAAFRELFRRVFSTARKLQKARAEGKLDADFESLLDDLLGIDAQTRYEAETVKIAEDWVNGDAMTYTPADGESFALGRGLGALLGTPSQKPSPTIQSSKSKAAEAPALTREVLDKARAFLPRSEWPEGFDMMLSRASNIVSKDNNFEVRKTDPTTIPQALQLILSGANPTLTVNRWIQHRNDALQKKTDAPTPFTEFATATKEPLPTDGVVAVSPDEIQTIPEDLARAEADAAKGGKGWAESVDLSQPVGAFRDENGALRIFDGHHRWLAAKMRGEKVNVRVKDYTSYSLARRNLAAFADTKMSAMMKKPEFKEAMFRVAAAKVAEIRKGQTVGYPAIAGFKDGEPVYEYRTTTREGADAQAAATRTEASLKQEAKFIRQLRERELIEEGMGELTSATILTYERGVEALKDDPFIAAMLAKGQLMSRTTAEKAGKLKTDGAGVAGDYNGAPLLPPSFYGGSIMPAEMAQALYDDGALKDAYPDTLWEKLSTVINSRRNDNEAFKKARDAVREVEQSAKQQAAKESEQWLQEARAKVPTEKERQMQALRLLDAILSAFPAEVRGRVGGFVKLASLGTDKAREAEIGRRLDKLEVELEKFAKKHFVSELDKLLAKVAPKGGGGEKATGKIGVAGHRWFEIVNEAVLLTEQQAQDEMVKLESILADAERESEHEDAFERWGILHQFGGFGEKSAAEMETALETARDVASRGRAAWKAIIEERKAARVELQQGALKELGGKANWSKTQGKAAQEADKGQAEKMGDFMRRHFSFVQTLQRIFGRGPTAQRYENAARAATRKKTDAMVARIKAFKSGMMQAVGGKTWRETQAKLYELQQIQSNAPVRFFDEPTTKTLEVPGVIAARLADGSMTPKAAGLTDTEAASVVDEWAKSDNRNRVFEVKQRTPGAVQPTNAISQNQAIHFTMLAKQESYREAMDRHGITAETLEDLEKWLTPEAKAVRAWLFAQYEAGYYSLNEVYKRMFGIDLPRVKEYAPGYFEKEGASTAVDPFGSGVETTGLAAGFLKKRKNHMSRPEQVDALQAYWQHTQQTEHWKAWAELTGEMRSVLGNKEVMRTVKAKAGSGAAADLSNWIDILEQNGVKDAQANAVLAKVMRAQARTALAFKLGVLMKQLPATLGSLSDIGAKEWISSARRVLSGSSVMSAQEMFNTPTIQRRIESGYSPEMRVAMQGPNAKPDALGDVLEWGMERVAWTDAAFTSFSAAVAFDAHYRAAQAALGTGVSDVELRKVALEQTENTVGRTAQPGEVMDRSLVELQTQGFGKLMFMFQSAQRQAWALVHANVSGALQGQVPKSEAAKVVFNQFILIPAITQTMSGLIRYLFSDDEPEEAWKVEDYLYAMLLGPSSGIMMMGAALDVLGSAYAPRSNNPLSGAMGDVKRLISDMQADRDVSAKDVGSAVTGAAILLSGYVNPSVEAAGVTWSVLKQALGLADRVGGTE